MQSIVEESVEHCVQYFHRFKYKCEYEVNFVRGEDGNELAYFTKT